MTQEVDLSVISISLGNQSGNHEYTGDFLGKRVYMARIGTNGDVALLKKLIKFFNDQSSGKPTKKHVFLKDFDIPRVPDALGLGGTTIYLWKGKTFKEGADLRKLSHRIPLLDGYGVKLTLEKMITEELINRGFFVHQNVLLTSAVDREGMALAFAKGKKDGKVKDVVYGDIMYLLGHEVPIKSLFMIDLIVTLLYPIMSRKPISDFYSTGEKQTKREPKWEKWQNWADVIAGDFHQIIEALIPDLSGKIVYSNTTTTKEVEELIKKNLGTLITTTPDMGGRSFGTNVMETLFVALGARPGRLEDYIELIIKLGWASNPRFFAKTIK